MRKLNEKDSVRDQQPILSVSIDQRTKGNKANYSLILSKERL